MKIPIIGAVLGGIWGVVSLGYLFMFYADIPSTLYFSSCGQPQYTTCLSQGIAAWGILLLLLLPLVLAMIIGGGLLGMIIVPPLTIIIGALIGFIVGTVIMAVSNKR